MKTLTFKFALLSAALLLTLGFANPGTAGATPAVGKPAPAFTGIDAQGKMHALSDYKGSIVVLEWTNHQCPFVEKHYATGNMQKLQAAARKQGIVWLAVLSSAPGEQGYLESKGAQAISKSMKAKHTAKILDPKGIIGRMYGARTTPHMYVIDKSGTLVYMGGIDDKPSTDHDDVKTAKNYVTAALDDIAGGKPVKTPVSRPYGCSVKY
ncbi:MAG: redoxin domain-containing protein [Rhodospirillales bacterium]